MAGGAPPGLPHGGTEPADAGARLTRPAPVTRLTLLCHGATRATRLAVFPAPDDRLAPRALRSLPEAAALGRMDRCWGSPAECAGATAVALGLAARPEPLLRDCDYGRWAGRSLDDVLAQDPDGLATWFADPTARPHGGDTLTEVAARVGDWLADCGARPGRVLAVTHPLVIRIAAAKAIGAPLDIIWRLDVAPLSRTRLTAQAGRWRLSALNETFGDRGPLALPATIP